MIQAIHIPSDRAFVVKREGESWKSSDPNRIFVILWNAFGILLIKLVSDFYSCYSRYKLFLYLKIFTVPLAQLVIADGS